MASPNNNLTRKKLDYEDLLNKMSMFEYQQLVMARNMEDNTMVVDHRMMMEQQVTLKLNAKIEGYFPLFDYFYEKHTVMGLA
jgi:hypothetical protein